MGCFSFTCAVSGLPIGHGDPVRYMLLTRNPYGERACYMHDDWFPRTLPIRAKYNDYGSIEDIEEGPLRDLIMEGLQRDLHEQGWGDNSVHDVPVKIDMTFEKLLEALWEERVKVRRKVDTFWPSVEEKAANEKLREALAMLGKPEKEVEPAPPKPFEATQFRGVPSMRSVESILRAGKVDLEKFMVNEEEHGSVRVRLKDYGDKKQHIMALEALEPLLTDYVTVIRAGTGTYSHGYPQLFCFPNPDADFHGGFTRQEMESNAPLDVTQMMIREDVWQALLTLKLDNDYRKPRFIRFPQYHRSIKKLAQNLHYFVGQPHFSEPEEEKVDPKKSVSENSLELLTKRMERQRSTEYKEPVLGEWFFKSPIPFTLGQGEHVKMLRDKGPLADEHVQVIAEMAFISQILGTTRHMWRPSTSAGPQHGLWKSHRDLLQAITQVAEKRARKRW